MPVLSKPKFTQPSGVAKPKSQTQLHVGRILKYTIVSTVSLGIVWLGIKLFDALYKPAKDIMGIIDSIISAVLSWGKDCGKKFMGTKCMVGILLTSLGGVTFILFFARKFYLYRSDATDKTMTENLADVQNRSSIEIAVEYREFMEEKRAKIDEFIDKDDSVRHESASVKKKLTEVLLTKYANEKFKEDFANASATQSFSRKNIRSQKVVEEKGAKNYDNAMKDLNEDAEKDFDDRAIDDIKEKIDGLRLSIHPNDGFSFVPLNISHEVKPDPFMSRRELDQEILTPHSSIRGGLYRGRIGPLFTPLS